MVMGWKPSSIIALAKSSVVTPVSFSHASSNSTSCMHGLVAERLAHEIAQAGADVVGVEHGILGRLPHAVGAVAQHVGERAHEHAHLAVEGGQAAERLAAVRDVALACSTRRNLSPSRIE